MSYRKIATITGPAKTVTVHYDASWQEYRVRIVGQPVETIYFTDSKEDAIATAHAMAEIDPPK